MLHDGSPPQAWGRHVDSRLHIERRRFTPTGVGTASGVAALSWGTTVHPHRRGDGDYKAGKLSSVDGSPPQAWGRLLGRHTQSAQWRFTPTGVGTALISCWHILHLTVHPHRRGDGLLHG